MSGYKDQLRDLQEHAKNAQDEIGHLAEDAWPDEAEKARLEGVLAYARTVLEATEPTLISQQAQAGLRDSLMQISDNPSSVPPNADPWGGAVLDALANLPVARGREVEQAVKDAAATFQRSAQQRLGALDSRVAKTRNEIGAVKELIETSQAELSEAINQRKTDIADEIGSLKTTFEDKLTQYDEQVRGEQTALSELRTSQASAFEEAEQLRIGNAKEQIESADEQLRELQERATRELDERVAEIRRMEEESAQLVGAIGLAGTAERYGEEARSQKDVADKWRYATVLLALLAVGGVIVAVLEKHPVAETFAGKLALSLILGGIATYAARQSSYHRHREQRARDLQLELTAFSPFIEPLSAEQQEEERVIMTRKTFGKTVAANLPDEEPGPQFLSLALRRRKVREAGETS